MSYSQPLLHIGILLSALLITGIYIIAAVMLLDEKHPSSWLMLAGGVITLFGIAASHLGPLFFTGINSPLWSNALSSFSSLGALTFAIALLLHATHRKGLQKRIDELEATLSNSHGS